MYAAFKSRLACRQASRHRSIVHGGITCLRRTNRCESYVAHVDDGERNKLQSRNKPHTVDDNKGIRWIDRLEREADR